MKPLHIGILAAAIIFGGFVVMQVLHIDHSGHDHASHAHGEHDMHFDEMGLEALAAHSSLDDCYVGYKRGVYNITDILQESPEAQARLLATCGTNSFGEVYDADPSIFSFTELMEEWRFVAILVE